MRKIFFILGLIFSLYTSNAQVLYGTTGQGGALGGGTICQYNAPTQTLSAAVNFDLDGIRPTYSQLTQAADGKLYGVTVNGGTNSYGTIFSYDPSTGIYSKLKNFEYNTGIYPFGGLVQASDGKLYGTTYNGGSSGYGVIFSFDATTATYTKLADFNGANGAFSIGSLMQASDGKLYGMTQNGGSSGYGVIFSFDATTATYTKLKDLDFINGAYPYGKLIQASDGKLYGMTQGGGSAGYGVIFSFDATTTTYTKLKDFDDANGHSPYGSLVQASDGKLYGMTQGGGSAGYGVIFSFDATTTTYTKLKDLDFINGAYPYGSLIQASDGKLYGMTSSGGSNYYGVIFSFDASSSTYTKLKDLNYNNEG